MDENDGDAVMQLNADEPIAVAFSRLRETKKHKSKSQTLQSETVGPRDDSSPEILVSEFNHSVEDHFKFVDELGKLCGTDSQTTPEYEVKRFSDSITFLREWRDFNYAPRVVSFACQHDAGQRDVIGRVTLSQFSSAAVPEESQDASKTASEKSPKDFVMNVGGLVWAMDWCPRFEHDSESTTNVEFVAIAVHPPESSYNKIGAPLIGRGAIQIWCLLSESGKSKDEPSNGKKRPRSGPQKKGTFNSNGPTEVSKPRGRPRKRPIDSVGVTTKVSRPRGRPRKKANTDPVENIDNENQFVQPLAIEYPAESPGSHCPDVTSVNVGMQVVNDDTGSPVKDSSLTENATASLSSASKCRGDIVSIAQECEVDNNSWPISRCGHEDSLGALVKSKYCAPKSAALPRMMLCLAHNGKVAWDVKWQPVDARRILAMGYLAVLLGNGALEVWEVPLPHTVKHVFPSHRELIDPRFIKLRPVFRCSMLKCGDNQSIPLTLEWSTASPYDMILVGCHDGTVALWKFTITDSSKETRPLLSFSADTGPIRTLAWSPSQSDVESANVIITAGHKGFRFWDIRDPFRPLWDHGITAVTCSLDWLSDPRCIFGCLDDGSLWLLNLEKTAYDIPVTGKSLPVTSKHGFHSFDCSSFSIWSIQASRSTGIVAYCGEEGTTFCFQPTTRSVRDPSRNRLYHNFCGSLVEEEKSTITVTTPSTSSGIGKDNGKPTEACDDKQPLAICHGTEPVDELGYAHTVNIKAPKSKLTSKSQPKKTDQTCKEDDGAAKEKLSFPPKNVAMHRVRWNVNKGSEKWLCHGGAAGLVRCQEIDLSFF